MKRIIARYAYTVFALLLAAGILSTTALAQGDLKVTVVRQAGKVEAKFSGSKDWTSSKPDMVLTPGDLMRTLKGGKVQLLFPGKTVILIKENSLLDIKALAPDGGGKVKAIAGDFLFNLERALSPGSTFEVESPGALAVVRGTIWAQFIGMDGSLYLIAFDNDVEVTSGGRTIIVPAGFETHVTPGAPPSDPTPATMTLDEVERSFAIGDDGTLTEQEIELIALQIDLQRLDHETRISHREFIDYFNVENTTGMLLIYRLVPDYRDRLGRISPALTDMMAPGGNPLPEVVQDAPLSYGRVVEAIQAINDRLDEMEELISRYYLDPSEEFERIQGLIPDGDPTLGVREGSFDSDGDGLSDYIELEIGLDPMINNLDEGFIRLIQPHHTQVFTWPSDSTLEFEYERLESPIVSDYRIWFEAGGIVYSQPASSESISITVDSLLDHRQGNFGSLFQDSTFAEFTWFVTARVDSAFLPGSDGHTSQMFSQMISSAKRTFELRFAEGGTAFCRVEPQAFMVRPDDTLRVNIFIDTTSHIQDIKIRLRFDPSVLDYFTGTTGMYWTNSTLFFGDSTPGEVTISGRVNRDTGFVTGQGILAQLEFTVTGRAGSISPLDLVETMFIGPGQIELSVLRENAFIEVESVL